jgi:uncharacterized protein YkwD
MQKLAALVITNLFLGGILFFPPSINPHTSEISTVQAKQKITFNKINISPSPSPTHSPSPKPTPSPKVIRKAAITPQVTSAPEEDSISFMMNQVNQYRKSKGLSVVSTSTESCNYAATRAKEISQGFNHDGFSNKSGYALVVENIAQNSDFKNVVPAWINSDPHRANMEKDTPFVCIAKYGNYYAYEGYKP